MPRMLLAIVICMTFIGGYCRPASVKPDHAPSKMENSYDPITKEQAIAIARKDLMRFRWFRPDDYNIDALETDTEWNLTFKNKRFGQAAISGGKAEYVINKKTSEIVKRQLYQ